MFKIRVGLVFLPAFAAADAAATMLPALTGNELEELRRSAETGLSTAEIVGSDAIESPAPGVIELVCDAMPNLGRQPPPLRLRWWKKTPVSAISGDQDARSA